MTALWGVGEQTARELQKLGLKTVGDIAQISRRTLERALGDALGAHLHALAHGIDDRTVVPNEAARSVGSEETFRRDLDSTEEIVREILRLSDRTAERLRAKGLCGRTVTLKVRFSNFKTITRSKTLGAEVDTTPAIYEVARGLFDKLDPARPRIRLLERRSPGSSPGLHGASSTSLLPMPVAASGRNGTTPPRPSTRSGTASGPTPLVLQLSCQTISIPSPHRRAVALKSIQCL